MASNGLVANHRKTVFMPLGLKMKKLKELHDRETKITTRVGVDNIKLSNHT
jgi:hypothetical protein